MSSADITDMMDFFEDFADPITGCAGEALGSHKPDNPKVIDIVADVSNVR